MGESKRYYYIKKKPQSYTDNKMDFKYEKPKVVTQSLFSACHNISKSGESVLDMDFIKSATSKTWIILLRWILLIILAISAYLVGSLFNVGIDFAKEDIVRKSETAAANLQEGALSLSQFNLEDALVNFKLANRNFNSALNSFSVLGQHNILLANLPLERSQIVQVQSLIKSGQHLAVAGINTVEAIEPVVQHWFYPKTNEKIADIGSHIGKLLTQNAEKLDLALYEVALAQKYLDNLQPNYVTNEYADLVIEAKTKTSQFKQALEMVAVIAKNLPKAIGFDNPRYYMLLNQNTNEARATGGFIGSYVIVELYKGKIESIFSDTSQRIDGQNPYSDIALPDPLKSVTAYYGIRDANWEPDFPTSARTIQKLYEQAGGGTVDGIIALNPTVVADILSVMGPLYMPDYNMTLTSDNFADRVQKHIEVDARGEYNAKQLLMDVIPIVMNQLLEADAHQMEVIGHKLMRRLINKDILLQFSDVGLESVITTLGWGGTIIESLPNTDYLYVVESNLGGNKSSSSLVREINHTVLVSSNGMLTDSLKINYSHQGTDNFPDGINKNYIRIYLPLGSKIDKIFGYDEDTEVDMDTVNGKTMVGFWVTTNPGQSSQIKLKYLLPFKLDFINSQGNYRLIVQKQSGLTKTTFNSQLEVFGKFSLSSDETIKHSSLFSDQLSKDELLSISIYKK